MTIEGHGIPHQVGRIDCVARDPGRSFYAAHFVPSYQVIEVDWYKTEKAEPVRVSLPVTAWKRFDR